MNQIKFEIKVWKIFAASNIFQKFTVTSTLPITVLIVRCAIVTATCRMLGHDSIDMTFLVQLLNLENFPLIVIHLQLLIIANDRMFASVLTSAFHLFTKPVEHWGDFPTKGCVFWGKWSENSSASRRFVAQHWLLFSFLKVNKDQKSFQLILRNFAVSSENSKRM